MTCKDCVHFKDCDDLAFHNFDHNHKMWLMEFWGNAEERCKDFEDASKERGEDA
jgi:hypothetical protein